MTFEREAGIGLRHTFAVVDHLDGCASGIDDEHVDSGGTGIDGILHKFLDHTCWALYHFAGCNLVGNRIG